MTTTTQTHRKFVGEPIRDKPATALPGIGAALGGKLEARGFNTAQKVMGQYLVMNEDAVKFSYWLKDVSGTNSQQAGACTQGLKEWCENNL